MVFGVMTGDHGNQWYFAKVELLTGQFTLYIEGYVGDGDEGDIALDDFALFARHCDRVNEHFWRSTVEPTLDLYVENFGYYPPYAGKLPGLTGYSIKKLFCTEGVLEDKKKGRMDDDKEGGRSMEEGVDMDGEMDMDMGHGSDVMMMQMMLDPFGTMMMMHRKMQEMNKMGEAGCGMEEDKEKWEVTPECHNKNLTGKTLYFNFILTHSQNWYDRRLK